MRYHTSRYIGFSLPLFLCSLLPAQPAQCTQDTVVGTYAVAMQGTMLVPSSAGSQPLAVPFVGLAITSIDSLGVISGPPMKAALGDTISSIPGAGSIQVNPDCTAVVKSPLGMTTNDVIMDEGKEIRSLMSQVPGGATAVVQGHGKRISRIPSTVAPVQCSPADVHGIYAYTSQGTFITPQASQLALTVGLASIDYQGQFSGSGKGSVGGAVMDWTGAGQLSVNADCSATLHATIQSGPMTDVEDAWMVVLEGGNELWLIQTSSTVFKPVLTATLKRISPIPAVSGNSSGAGPSASIDVERRVRQR